MKSRWRITFIDRLSQIAYVRDSHEENRRAAVRRAREQIIAAKPRLVLGRAHVRELDAGRP